MGIADPDEPVNEPLNVFWQKTRAPTLSVGGHRVKMRKKKQSFIHAILEAFRPNKPDGTPKSKRERYNNKIVALERLKKGTDQTMGVAAHLSDIFLTLGSLRRKPGPIQIIAAGTKITNVLYSKFVANRFTIPNYVDPLEEYLNKIGGEWESLETNKLRIVEILNENEIGKVIKSEEEEEEEPPTTIRGAKRNSTHQVVHAIVEGCDIVWKQTSQGNGNGNNAVAFPMKLVIRKEQKEEVFLAIGNLVWKAYGSNHLTTSINRKGSAFIEFMEDLFATDILQSKIGDKIANNTKRFLAVPEIETRAILLYGPPGTGKSTAARYIAHVLGFRSLRIGWDILEHGATLVQCLDILRPDLIIIDDIDRSPNSGKLLTSLELLRKRTKVIIASANYPGNLDYAVLRPGRFDEAIKVHILDDEVIKRTIADENISESAFQELKGLPIAYINEYSLRKKVLGEKEAARSIKELFERIEMGKREDEDDVDQESYQVLKDQIKELKKKAKVPKKQKPKKRKKKA